MREARPGDGGGLAELHLDMARYYVALAPNDFQMPETEGLAEFFDPKPPIPGNERLWLVAEVEGRIIGAIIAYLQQPNPRAHWQMQPWAGDTTLRIDYLAVFGTHRRMGIASQLVEATESWGRERGATLSITGTYQGSPLSVPFWRERQGYVTRSIVLHKQLH